MPVIPAHKLKAGDPYTLRIDFGVPLAGVIAAEFFIGPAKQGSGRPLGEVSLTATLGAGVEVVEVDGGQRIAVTLSEADTAGWAGLYAHELTITDADGVERTAKYGAGTADERYFDVLEFEPDYYQAAV